MCNLDRLNRKVRWFIICLALVSPGARACAGQVLLYSQSTGDPTAFPASPRRKSLHGRPDGQPTSGLLGCRPGLAIAACLSRQWTGSRADGHVGDLEVARGGFQVGVAEQDLDGAEIHTVFEEMSSKGMPQRVRMNRFPNARRLCRTSASQVDSLGTDGPSAVCYRKQPVSGPLGSPIQAQKLQQLGR